MQCPTVQVVGCRGLVCAPICNDSISLGNCRTKLSSQTFYAHFLDKWKGGVYARSLLLRGISRVILFLLPLSDCPQVQAVFDYQAQQPDELSLERGDVVKVYRKMADGMSLAAYSRKLIT